MDFSKGYPSLGNQELEGALNELWICDLGQGNLNNAHYYAEKWLTENPSPDSWIASAIVARLRNDYDRSIELFENAFQSEQAPGHRFVIAAMARHCLECATLLPDGRKEEFIEWKNDTGFRERVALFEQRYRELDTTDRTDWEKILGIYFFSFLSNLPSVCAYLLEHRKYRRLGEQIPVQPIQLLMIKELVDLLTKVDCELVENFILLKFGELYGFFGDLKKADEMIADETFQLKDHTKAVASFLRGRLKLMKEPYGFPELFGCIPMEFRELDTLSLVKGQKVSFEPEEANTVRSMLNESLDIFIKIGFKRGEARCKITLAHCEMSSRNYPAAWDWYKSAEDDAFSVGDLTIHHLAFSGRLLSGILRRMPESYAVNAAARIVQFIKEKSIPQWGLGIGLAFAEVGQELIDASKVEEALQALIVADTVFKSLNAPLRLSQTCMLRSKAYESFGAYNSSWIELENASEWQKKATKTSSDGKIDWLLLRHQFSTYSNRLLIAVGERNADQLEKDYEEVLVLKEKLPRIPAEEFQRVERVAQEAMESTQRIAAAQYSSVAEFCSLEEKILAIQDVKHLQLAWEVEVTLRWIEPQYRYNIPFYRGLNLKWADDLTGARREYEKAMVAAEARADREYLKGSIYSELYENGNAVKCLKRYIEEDYPNYYDSFLGLKSPENKSTTSNMYNVAQLFADVGEWTLAEEEYKKSMYEEPQQIELLLTSEPRVLFQLLNLACIAWHTSSPDKASKRFESLLDAFEYRRYLVANQALKLNYGKDPVLYRSYGECCRFWVSQGSWKKAFYISELGRARAITESIQQQRSRIKQGAEESWRSFQAQSSRLERLNQQWAIAVKTGNRVETEIEDLKREVGEAKTLLQAIEVELYKKAAAPTTQLPQRIIDSLDSCLKHIPEGTLVLAYFYYDTSFLAWGLTRSGIVKTFESGEMNGETFRHRPFGHRTTQWIDAFAEGREDPSWTQYLERTLLIPFDSYISEADHILIVPFRDLNVMPFQALTWRGQPLGSQKELSYLPATSILKFFKRRGNPDLVNGLAVGDPVNMNVKDQKNNTIDSLVPLPSAGLEARVIGDECNFKTLIGKDATESAVLEALVQTPNILLFATHGWFQSGAPLDSGLALANGDYLSVDDLMSFNLESRIIVLSACDTGKGELFGPELVGIVRALLSASVHAVIVSMVVAPDISASMIMIKLFRLLKEKVSPGRALFQAQQWLSSMTATEALEFWQDIEESMEVRGTLDADMRARLQVCKGDVYALIPDYSKASEAYGQAANFWESILDLSNAESFRNDSLQNTVLARSIDQELDYDQLIFSAPMFWANFALVGNWR